jgi:hypothetical protein
MHYFPKNKADQGPFPKNGVLALFPSGNLEKEYYIQAQVIHQWNKLLSILSAVVLDFGKYYQ